MKLVLSGMYGFGAMPGERSSRTYESSITDRAGLMIVDSHCHAGKGDGLTGPSSTSAQLGQHLRRAERVGIQGAVLMAASSVLLPRDNTLSVLHP
jgi:hypothetical protein